MDKVSVLVRTCGRPEVLKKCIESICRQTYKNIEIVIVEDGESVSKAMLDTYFSEVEIKYHCFGEHRGRVAAGNKAMEIATGDYFNFLDDDDIFYPDHIKNLMDALSKSEFKVAYDVAETGYFLNIINSDRVLIFKKIMYRQSFNRLYLLFQNYIPIQTILFHRSLFDEFNGFREDMDFLEDWELWVRYAMHEDFLFVNKVSSLYFVPLFNGKRQGKMNISYEDTVSHFKKYVQTFDAYSLNVEMRDYMLNIAKSPLRKKIRKLLVKTGVLKIDNLEVK